MSVDIGDGKKPGAIAFTRTLCGPSSTASAFVSASTPPFDA